MDNDRGDARKKKEKEEKMKLKGRDCCNGNAREYKWGGSPDGLKQLGFVLVRPVTAVLPTAFLGELKSKPN